MIPEGKVVHTDNARGDNYGAKHMEVIQGAILNQHFNIKKHYCMIMAMTGLYWIFAKHILQAYDNSLISNSSL